MARSSFYEQDFLVVPSVLINQNIANISQTSLEETERYRDKE